MPNIIVDGPIIDIEKKRALVKEMTEVAVKVYGIPKEHIIVVIRENSPDNVGSGGMLITDIRKQRKE